MDAQAGGEPAQPRRRSLAASARGHLDHPAASKDQDQPRADRGRRGETEDHVGHPTNPAIAGSARPTPAGGRERHRGRDRYGRDGDEPWKDEAGSADHRTEAAAEAPGAVHGELRRGGAREEVGGGDAVFELGSRQPSALFDAQLAEERDVRGRAAEPDAADPCPLSSDDGQPDSLGRRLLHGRVQSLYRTNSTGQAAWCTTLLATPPSSRLFHSVMPRDPRTIRSARVAAATSMICWGVSPVLTRRISPRASTPASSNVATACATRISAGTGGPRSTSDPSYRSYSRTWTTVTAALYR